MPKVLLVDPFLANDLEHFRRLLPEDVALAVCTTYEDAEFARLAADADVLVNTLRPIDAAALAMAPRARFVQQFGAGYDPVDVAAVNARNVLVAHNPGVNAAGVAEHTLLLMLAVVKNLAWSEHWARQGQFMLDEMPASGIGDLADATVGLVGLGAIGQAVAEHLRSFGAHVVYAGRTRQTPDVEERLGVSWLPLPDLLQASEYRQPASAIDGGNASPDWRARAGDDAPGVVPDQHRAWRSRRRGSTAASHHVGPPGRSRIGRHRRRARGAQPFRRSPPGPRHAAPRWRQPWQHRANGRAFRRQRPAVSRRRGGA